MVPHEFVTTGFELPGYRIKRNFGIVRGIVVRSRSIVGTIGASLQTIVGGNISLFSNLCEQTRNDAFDLMLQHAEALGANAVIGVRYDAGVVRVRTGAGVKTLRLLERRALHFDFEMNMGRPELTATSFQLALSWGPRDVTLLWVGNPQCAVPVDHFDFDWRALGAEIERHPHFPNRTNVSFVKAIDEHTIDVRFWERGAGETMSSGTGSTGAAAMAVARGLVPSPVKVQTPAGALDLRVEGDIYLTGPAEIVGEGVFHSGSGY